MGTAGTLLTLYRQRWKRRRLLLRALRKRRQLRPVADRTASISASDILVFATVRNESLRLPHFLKHHRGLGVGHFLIVDNASTDGTAEMLAAQPDVSLWTTPAGYKAARFGIDWLTWLMARHGHGHWCLTLDADELFIYPHHDSRPLPALTEWLDERGRESFGALMLELYPRGPVGAEGPADGDDPLAVLQWFDGGNYTIAYQEALDRLWIQGGPRARAFFAADPRRAPTLNKVPLVKWNRRFAYVTSTHALLPRRLNRVFDREGGEMTSGVLLHTKFLGPVAEKAAEEKARREHFENSALYDAYYDRLEEGPVLWSEASSRYLGWRQLEAMGLMSKGLWF